MVSDRIYVLRCLIREMQLRVTISKSSGEKMWQIHVFHGFLPFLNSCGLTRNVLLLTELGVMLVEIQKLDPFPWLRRNLKIKKTKEMRERKICCTAFMLFFKTVA